MVGSRKGVSASGQVAAESQEIMSIE